MATAAEKEKLRRLAVEKAYVKPEPRHDWADAAPSDRPSVTVDRIVAAAKALGWVVTEKTRLDWHPPTWVTDPDGGPAEYKAKPRVQYALQVTYRLPMDSPTPTREEVAESLGKLGLVRLLMVDGVKRELKIGIIGEPTAKPSTIAISGVAKLITETGVRA